MLRAIATSASLDEIVRKYRGSVASSTARADAMVDRGWATTRGGTYHITPLGLANLLTHDQRDTLRRWPGDFLPLPVGFGRSDSHSGTIGQVAHRIATSLASWGLASVRRGGRARCELTELGLIVRGEIIAAGELAT